MNYGILSRYLGYFSAAMGAPFAVSLLVALLYRESAAISGLLLSIVATSVLGAALIALGRKASSTMYQREALALVGIAWILAAALGALPYLFSGELDPIDAYFESMSGITTTGATIIANIEALPKSLLLWRALSHWLGGIGIVVLFIAVLPYLGAGGKQLFRSEVSGPDSRSLRPRIRDTAAFLYKVYIALTVTQIVLLMIAGMSLYDAVCHTFSTIATGGFSTRQASIAAYDSLAIELIIIVFMLIAGGNFALYFAMLRGDWFAPFKDTEWRVYIGIFAVCTVLITLNLIGVRGTGANLSELAQAQGFEGSRYAQVETQTYGIGHSLRAAAFQVTSIMTSTGYVTEDFDVWPHFSRMLLVVLMFVGACGGSTGGGFKIIRVIMLLKMAYWRLEMSFRPKTYRVVRISNHVIDDDIQRRVSGFFVLYLALFIAGSLFMSGLGIPFQTAITAVIATMNNIGPGLELVGALMDYHLLPDTAKLFLCFCMVVGRLEIFTIFVLFVPGFWRSAWSH